MRWRRIGKYEAYARQMGCERRKEERLVGGEPSVWAVAKKKM